MDDNQDEFGNFEITFLQDGVPVHYYMAVRIYLDEKYRGRYPNKISCQFMNRNLTKIPNFFMIEVFFIKYIFEQIFL